MRKWRHENGAHRLFPFGDELSRKLAFDFFRGQCVEAMELWLAINRKEEVGSSEIDRFFAFCQRSPAHKEQGPLFRWYAKACEASHKHTSQLDGKPAGFVMPGGPGVAKSYHDALTTAVSLLVCDISLFGFDSFNDNPSGLRTAAIPDDPSNFDLQRLKEEVLGNESSELYEKAFGHNNWLDEASLESINIPILPIPPSPEKTDKDVLREIIVEYMNAKGTAKERERAVAHLIEPTKWKDFAGVKSRAQKHGITQKRIDSGEC